MCTHKKWFYPEPALNDWTGEYENVTPYEEFTYADIDTGRFKCTQCNEVMYYTGLWKRFYEDGIPCPGSDRVVKSSTETTASTIPVKAELGELHTAAKMALAVLTSRDKWGSGIENAKREAIDALTIALNKN